jgi:hypothetical protein
MANTPSIAIVGKEGERMVIQSFAVSGVDGPAEYVVSVRHSVASILQKLTSDIAL